MENPSVNSAPAEDHHRDDHLAGLPDVATADLAQVSLKSNPVPSIPDINGVNTSANAFNLPSIPAVLSNATEKVCKQIQDLPPELRLIILQIYLVDLSNRFFLTPGSLRRFKSLHLLQVMDMTSLTIMATVYTTAVPDGWTCSPCTGTKATMRNGIKDLTIRCSQNFKFWTVWRAACTLILASTTGVTKFTIYGAEDTLEQGRDYVIHDRELVDMILNVKSVRSGPNAAGMYTWAWDGRGTKLGLKTTWRNDIDHFATKEPTTTDRKLLASISEGCDRRGVH